MQKEKNYFKTKQEILVDEEFLNLKNINLPTTITEIIESREQNTLPISLIMPNIKEFVISFPNLYNHDNKNSKDKQNETIDNNKKIKINKNDLFKIYKMSKTPKEDLNSYILFSFTTIKSEIVTNIIKTYKLDYNELKKLIPKYYIQIPNKENSIEIDKNTLKKIFDLLSIIPNERLSLMQFYEVDDENESENEDEEENETEKISISLKENEINEKENNSQNSSFEIERKIQINSSFKNDREENISISNEENINNNIENYKKKNIKTNKKNNKNGKSTLSKININYIGGKKNNVEKINQSSMDNFKKILDKIPSIFNKIKIKDKNYNFGAKKKSKDKLIRENQKSMGINKSIHNIKDNFKKLEKENNENHKSSLIHSNGKSNWLKKEMDRENILGNVHGEQGKKNISTYAFILPKSFRYENNPMFLVGSIPQLGNWNPNISIPMEEELKNNQIFYTKYLEIKKEDFPFEYKYLYKKEGKIFWLGKSNINYKAYPEYIDLYQSSKEKKNILSIFDLNIRYLNKIDGFNIWDNRKKKLLKIILKYIPDILFFQEITRTQYEYLEENLNSIYENVGIYRDNTDHSEKCTISYNKIKYTLTDWGQFWLSSTPYTQGSNDFGNFFPRICTWALLKQINGEQFLFFNIHLDHVNFKAHLLCINVVLNESEKILRNFPETKVVFLGGCFYCEEDDEIIEKLKNKGYKEILFENTFHDFTGDADRHWDYLFWKENDDINIELKKAFVPKKDSIINLKKQQYISDHYPVISEFEIGNKNINNNLIFDEDEKKEFSELDEEENLRSSREFEEYENNDEINDIKKSRNINKLKENNNEIGEDEEYEEVEGIEIKEKIEDNGDGKKITGKKMKVNKIKKLRKMEKKKKK